MGGSGDRILVDADPPALERALEAIADYPLPPRWEPEALELSPATTRIREQSWRSGPRRCFRSGCCGSWQVRQGPPVGAMGAANRTERLRAGANCAGMTRCSRPSGGGGIGRCVGGGES